MNIDEMVAEFQYLGLNAYLNAGSDHETYISWDGCKFYPGDYEDVWGLRQEIKELFRSRKQKLSDEAKAKNEELAEFDRRCKYNAERIGELELVDKFFKLASLGWRDLIDGEGIGGSRIVRVDIVRCSGKIRLVKPTYGDRVLMEMTFGYHSPKITDETIKKIAAEYNMQHLL